VLDLYEITHLYRAILPHEGKSGKVPLRCLDLPWHLKVTIPRWILLDSERELNRLAEYRLSKAELHNFVEARKQRLR
jgi:hypothetical protein